ncbi:hypothetical protein KGQ72_01790 [Patescibacteria group bacterium]|nr:hypothetical protein [Patescibacteria group bacterium]MDE2022497.1 hypothetical protein [Patescibacteria group bacterium]
MAVNIHILKASGTLEKFEDAIVSAFEGGLSEVTNKITLPSVDVVIDDNGSSAIPETGVGGFAPSAHLLYIHINPEFKDIEQRLGSEIRSTLTHELHHCACWAARGYGKTLLEALISEGLADHFDIEVNGGEPKLWSVAISSVELARLLDKAKSEFGNDSYDHAAWFFGSKEKDIPRWAGYSLGFSLVDDYLKKNNKKASELVAADAFSFVA